MIDKAKEIRDSKFDIAGRLSSASVKFSICTIVNDFDQYEDMMRSFLNGGFGLNDCEYLFANNVSQNNFDAFAAIRHFLYNATGEIIIICHQDVRLIKDGKDRLIALITELNMHDQNWSVIGNAGIDLSGERAVRISDPWKCNQTSFKNYPIEVQSLDENFLAINKLNRPTISSDLTGFHWYGVDLCILSSICGYRCYVIDFHLEHLSKGVVSYSYRMIRRAVVAKYYKNMKSKTILSVTGHRVPISNSKSYIFLAESKGFWIQKIRSLTRRLGSLKKRLIKIYLMR